MTTLERPLSAGRPPKGRKSDVVFTDKGRCRIVGAVHAGLLVRDERGDDWIRTADEIGRATAKHARQGRMRRRGPQMTGVFSDGFAAPIIWGVKLAFSIADIAEGLQLDEAVVRAVIESRSPVRFPTGRFGLIEIPKALNVWERA